MGAGALLELEDLRVDYGRGPGRLTAVRGVTLAARAGEALGIVGESGCGKSTLAATIAGLQPVGASIVGGRIRFDGETIDAVRQRRLRGDDIAMIFQDPMQTFNPVLTVGSQLVDFQHRMVLSKAERRRRAIAMLARVGIADPERRFSAYPHELSGGMRQRVAIAAALLVDPRLLIADEPTTALDVTTEVEIVRLLAGLRRDFGGAIVIVTHHLGVVAQLCDRVAVMYAGEVVEEGPVDAVFHAPCHPYTRALLACDPARIDERLAQLPVIPGHLPDLSSPIPGCAFAPRCADREPACTDEGALAFDVGESRVLCRRAAP